MCQHPHDALWAYHTIFLPNQGEENCMTSPERTSTQEASVCCVPAGFKITQNIQQYVAELNKMIELDIEFSVHKITTPQVTHPHLPSYSLVQGEKCQVWQQGANAVLRSAHTMGLNPATSCRDQSHRVNWPFWLQNLVAGTKIWSLQLVPRIQTGLNLWDQSQGLKLVSATRF